MLKLSDNIKANDHKEERYIAVAQLLMVDASQEVEGTRSHPITNLLDPLLLTVIDQLNLGK